MDTGSLVVVDIIVEVRSKKIIDKIIDKALKIVFFEEGIHHFKKGSSTKRRHTLKEVG